MRTSIFAALAALSLIASARADEGSGSGSEAGSGSATGSEAGSGSATAGGDAKATYTQYCAKCHGEDGTAKTKMGKKAHATNFTRAKWQKRTTDEEIVKTITDGFVEHGKRKMPAFKEKLSAEQINALVPYVRAFGGAAAAPAEKPAE